MVRTARQGRSWRAARFGAWFALLQALCVVVSLQLSGVPHAVEDVAAMCDVLGDDDCPDEPPGHECPPGCPSCHCAHPAAAAPMAATFNGVAPPTEVGKALVGGGEDAPPVSAASRGVWRPPRRA